MTRVWQTETQLVEFLARHYEGKASGDGATGQRLGIVIRILRQGPDPATWEELKRIWSADPRALCERTYN